ncbi:MAG TPA: PAS domain S-box protein [Leptolyngbyaceae cyanobacterium]
MKAASPSNELARQELLRQCQGVDTDPEQVFDDLIRLAAQVCDTPIAAIDLRDENRQWFQAQIGLDKGKMPSDCGERPICIPKKEIVIITDTLAARATRNSSLVTSYPYMRFYAGVPLITPEGEAIGTLCVIDQIPREISQEQVESLIVLSRHVVTHLQLRRKLATLACTALEYQQLEAQLTVREKLLTDFLENGTVGLHWVGPDGIIRWANQAELDLLGYSRQEYIGQHIAKFHVDRTVIDEILQKLAANETIRNYEARLRCKDGSIKHVLIDSNVFWENGEFIHSRCFTRDITDRKTIEEERDRFFTLSLDMLCIANVEGYFKRLNPAFEEILGYPHQELIAQPFFNFVHPEDIMSTIKELEKLAEGTPTIKFENRYRCKDGAYKWLAWRAFPLVEEGLIYAIARDITLDKQAEQERIELLQREQSARNRITNILESITDAFFALDNQWCFTYLNRQAEQLLQKTQAELLGKNIWDKFPEAVNSTFYREYHKAFLEQTSVEFEEFFPPLNTWFYVHAYPGKNSLSVYFQDITERKQIEQKIREQAALLDIATDAIFVQNMQHKILFWNKGAERLYGWSASEVLGTDISDILLYQDINFQYIKIQKALAESGAWQGELNQLTKSGKKIIVQSRWTLVKNEENQPKSVLIVNSDITEKKLLEAQFLRAQRMESIGTLASGIAHDLNNVLAPMLMAIQLLQIQLNDDRCQRLLPVLESNIKRGADLVKQVLSFARGIDGERTLLQLNHLISEINHIVRQTFPKSIKLITDIPQYIWAISGDATQLHQVLMNLCINARDAMPDGGILTITAENVFIDENLAKINIDAVVGYYIAISVSDTGIGMSPEIVDRIFEPFFTTKEVGKGTGLGLSTVIGIVKSHGGFVNVYSELGKGTRFQVYLPAKEEIETEQVEKLKLIEGQGELIFIIDDEIAIREITKTSLEASGYNAILASDGLEAVEIYQQYYQEIALVLLDMMMPNMDGLTTINKLKEINPAVKIIAMSGLTSSEMGLMISEKKVKGLLAKPYTTRELLKTISEVVNLP